MEDRPMQPQEIRPASATPRKRGVAVVGAEVKEMLSTQVRVSGGFTYAAGCINPDTGRMSWGMMCGHFGIPRYGVRRHRDAPPAAASCAELHRLPPDLRATVHGRVYAFLLDWAEKSDVAPSNADIGAGIDRESSRVPLLMQKLESAGYITIPARCRSGRSIRIVATDKTLHYRRAGA